MTVFKSLALGAALCAAFLAMPMTDAAAKPAGPTWAEQCKDKNGKDRADCCFGKRQQCDLDCMGARCTGDRIDCRNETNRCFTVCENREKSCKQASLGSRFSTRNTSGQLQAADSNADDVCCQRGNRTWQTSQRDCRRRGGREVRKQNCTRRGTSPTAADRICCVKGNSKRLTSSRDCKAHRGRVRPVSVCHERQPGGDFVCCRHVHRGKRVHFRALWRDCRAREGTKVSWDNCRGPDHPQREICCQHESKPPGLGARIVAAFTIGDKKIFHTRTTRDRCGRFHNAKVIPDRQCGKRPSTLDKRNRRQQCEERGKPWVWNNRRGRCERIRDKRDR